MGTRTRRFRSGGRDRALDPHVPGTHQPRLGYYGRGAHSLLDGWRSVGPRTQGLTLGLQSEPAAAAAIALVKRLEIRPQSSNPTTASIQSARRFW